MKCGNLEDNNSCLPVKEVRDMIGMFFMVLLNSLASVASLCVIVPVMANTWLLNERSITIFIKSIMVLEYIQVNVSNNYHSKYNHD
jgi:hypothetical protein